MWHFVFIDYIHSVWVASCASYQIFDIIYCSRRNRIDEKILKTEANERSPKTFRFTNPETVEDWSPEHALAHLWFNFNLTSCVGALICAECCVPAEYWEIAHSANTRWEEKLAVRWCEDVLWILYVNAKQINCHRLHPRQIFTYSLLPSLAKVFAPSIPCSTSSLRRTRRKKKTNGKNRQTIRESVANGYMHKNLFKYLSKIVFLNGKSLCNLTAPCQKESDRFASQTTNTATIVKHYVRYSKLYKKHIYALFFFSRCAHKLILQRLFGTGTYLRIKWNICSMAKKEGDEENNRELRSLNEKHWNVANANNIVASISNCILWDE